MFLRRISARYLSTTQDPVVDLLAETLARNKLKNAAARKQPSWMEAPVLLKRQDKRRRVRKVQGSVLQPVNSTAFSMFPQIESSLCAKLNSEFQSTMGVQNDVLPVTLNNRSVVVQAETGSGKTLTFAIPVINRVLKGELSIEKPCLVLSPTKELAEQIYS
eukprot:sb/3472838/